MEKIGFHINYILFRLSRSNANLSHIGAASLTTFRPPLQDTVPDASQILSLIINDDLGRYK